MPFSLAEKGYFLLFLNSSLDIVTKDQKTFAEVYENKPFAALRYEDLQAGLDNCTLKHSCPKLILGLMHQMYVYTEIWK